MTTGRPISKSDFKLALECERKLVYKRRGYPGSVAEDPFLEFLQDGGFMVEAVARALFPHGVDASEAGYPVRAVRDAKRESRPIALFEPDFSSNGLRARVDILAVEEGRVRLIEIKAASLDADARGSQPFRGSRGGIDSGWRPYLLDVAFQTMVVRSALGDDVGVQPELCVVDISRPCGEACTFKFIELIDARDAGFGRPRARYLGELDALRADHCLRFEVVSSEVSELLPEVASLVARLRSDELDAGPAPIRRECRDCEYRGAASGSEQDGFAECWGPLARARHHILDLHRIDIVDGRDRSGLRELIELGVAEIADLPDHVLGESESTVGRRQAMHRECVRSGREWIDGALAAELRAIPWPHHFVDFETSRTPLPYHGGMRPYGQNAFQFSCHTIERPDSHTLLHREWINLHDGYPNFHFAAALRDAIGEAGAMLVWSHHERSVLREIAEELHRIGSDPPLASWIDRLVAPPDEGGRIFDLHDLCRKHHLHPDMKGRTSIKYALPAVWGADESLRKHAWFRDYERYEGEVLLDPYRALEDAMAGVTSVEAVRNGTAAMRAYQEMLFGVGRTDASQREARRQLLLRYCALDTIAMVVIWMYWLRRLGIT